MGACGGNEDVVEFLIEKGANLRAKDKKGKTALEIAREHKQEKVEKILEKAMEKESVNEKKSNGFMDILFRGKKR